MFYCRIILLVLFSTGSFMLSAQNSQPAAIKRCPVKSLNFESGLRNNGTTNIITDKLGFTWVSTMTGLQRYNGYTLQNIKPIAGKDTFNIDYPVYFFAMHDGVIWISFKQTVIQYDPASNLFQKMISLEGADNLVLDIVPLKETEKGVWCMQKNKGIVLYNRSGQLVKQYSFFKNADIDEILNSLELIYLNKITCNNKYIFINKTSSKSDYMSLNNNEGNILAINTDTEEAREVNLGHGNVLGITCNDQQLFVLNKQGLSVLSLNDNRILKKTIPDDLGLSNSAFGIIRVKKDELLVSFNNRLFEFSLTGDYKDEMTDLNRNPVVLSGFIHQIVPDQFGRIWLITNNDVKRIEDLEIPFSHFVYPDEKSNFVKSIVYDKQMNVLIAGCFYTGIQLYDTLANPLWKSPLASTEVKNVVSMEKLTTDEYLVTTYDKGWHILNLRTKTSRPFTITAEQESMLTSRHANFANNIQRLDKNTLLIATATNVFKCTVSGTVLLKAIPLLPKESPNNAVNCMMYDSGNNLWVGSFSGLLQKLDNKGQLLEFLTPGKYGVRCISEDPAHHIWVGTEKGLYIYSPDGVLLKTITIETGLRNDCIYGILPLDTGAAVYASSNMGISYISFNGTIKNFTKEIGLQENEFNTGASYKSATGRFYFGGVNGITAFYPASLSVINDTPHLYITKLIVNDSLYNSSAGTWKGDTIRLNYNRNRLHIDLAAIGMLNTNEYVYQYRMTPFENAWQTTYQPTGINYTLEPGKYVLELVCRPVLSSEISYSKKFVIIISPPWWQTWWFRIAAFVLVAAIIALIVQQYNRRKYVKKIQALQTQHEIQNERERISRDLHDNLGVQANAILHSSSQLEESDTDTKIVARELQETAKEMLLNLRETLWAMKTSDVSTTELWLRIINFMKQMGRHYTAISFRVEGEAPKGLIISSNKALNMVLVLQEAVNNAVKHAGAQTITAASSAREKDWEISITDDGKGFDPEGATPGKENYGLQNMKERAVKAGFRYSIESEPGRGTVAKIILTL